MPQTLGYITTVVSELFEQVSVEDDGGEVANVTLSPLRWHRIKLFQSPYVMRCAIWYYLCNLKNMKNTHGGKLL